MQSGSALCDWAIERSPLKFAQAVGDSVGCPSSTTSQLVACLRTISPTALLKAQSKVKVSGYKLSDACKQFAAMISLQLSARRSAEKQLHAVAKRLMKTLGRTAKLAS